LQRKARRAASTRGAWRHLLAVVLLQLLLADVALAWVYPEHRAIALLAARSLDPERKAEFDSLWAAARTGHEQRLCAAGADTEQGLAPSCIDWAALSAIAGDHSCSSKGMLDTVLGPDWILQVADVAAQLGVDLARIGVAPPAPGTAGSKTATLDVRRYVEDEAVRAQLINALRTADTRLQRADPEYATRAGSNGAHFLLPRPRTDMTPREYAELTLKVGSDISAIGVYAWFHVSALQKAARLADEQLAPEQRQALARAALADEAFALHFLEDTFAAGHVAGAWGDASQRKGTHDYYNESGLEAFTWGGGTTSAVLLGDAHMRPEDAERAGAAVRKSLAQVIDQATGHEGKFRVPDTPAAPAAPDAFDVCKNNVLVQRDEGMQVPPVVVPMLADVLLATPIPGLGPGTGSMPRFRAEVGPFLGVVGSFGLRGINGGFAESQDQTGFISDVDLAARIGLGLDGVLGDSGDGLVFAQIGIRADSTSSNKISSRQLAAQPSSLGAAIPNRMGLSTRFRMPFYVIPGDLLFMAPLYFLSPQTYTNMAVVASNGGLIPWQAGIATPIGRFQFVLGRELGVTLYGVLSNDSLIVPAAAAGGLPTVVDFKSTYYELPIVEYRPWRAFDSRQSSAAIIQLYAGADVPRSVRVDSPVGAATPHLRTIYSLGVRFILDWRHY
jgi:hypothetical protein